MIIQSAEIVAIPLVSVVIPSYNRAETVSQTIESILNQRCNFDFEIIIGDDCSTDSARDVLLAYQKQYPSKINLLFHDTNIGLGANWATCVKHCRGKYIANCDNDDYWHNVDKLQLQVDYMERVKEANVLFTNHRNHNRKTDVMTEEIAWIDTALTQQQAFFRGKFNICNATIMYRTDFLKKHINLDDYIRHQFTLQDWNTWIILSAYTDFAILPTSSATFGIETESITRPTTYEKIITRFDKEKECFKYVCDLFPDDLTYNEREYDIYVNGVLLSLAFKRRDAKKANEFATKMLELGDTSWRTRLSVHWLGFWAWWLLKRVAR